MRVRAAERLQGHPACAQFPLPNGNWVRASCPLRQPRILSPPHALLAWTPDQTQPLRRRSTVRPAVGCVWSLEPAVSLQACALGKLRDYVPPFLAWGNGVKGRVLNSRLARAQRPAVPRGYPSPQGPFRGPAFRAERGPSRGTDWSPAPLILERICCISSEPLRSFAFCSSPSLAPILGRLQRALHYHYRL